MKLHTLAIPLVNLLLTLSWSSFNVAEATSSQVDTQKAFFENLEKICGQQFAGETQFPQAADHPLVGKKLVMSIKSCGEKEIRIPFHVGEDKSRTWILTLTDKGLLFKHDHRHADGTPDRITMYGGLAASGGTPFLQRFPADSETVKLIPEAASNVWTLQIVPEKKQFIYSLERNNEPRYKALFNLKPVVDEPARPGALRLEHLTPKGQALTVGETFKLRFKLMDTTTEQPKDELKDVRVLWFLAPGVWQKREFARPVGGGIYELDLNVPEAGVYFVFVESASQGMTFKQLPPLSLQAIAATKPNS